MGFTINNLSSVDALSDGDALMLWNTSNGDSRKVSLSGLVTYLLTKLNLTDGRVTTYSVPSATGFTSVLPDDSDSKWLILTPTAGFAAGAITLPSVSNSVDRQTILVNSTQAVTNLTINGNGSTVTGAPTTLAANGYFQLRFDAVTKTWYRVG